MQEKRGRREVGKEGTEMTVERRMEYKITEEESKRKEIEEKRLRREQKRDVR